MMRRRRTTGSPPRFFDSLFIVGRVSEGVGEPVWVRKGVSPGSPVRGEQFERSEQTNHDCTTLNGSPTTGHVTHDVVRKFV